MHFFFTKRVLISRRIGTQRMFFLPLKNGHLQHGIMSDLWGTLS